MNALQSAAIILFMWIVIGAIIAAHVFDTGYAIFAVVMMVVIQFAMIIGARDVK